MNFIKKATLFGSAACLGITLYASLGQSIGQTKAVNTSSTDMANLTESAQSLTDFEMSLNNILLATNRINFINDNLISVNRDYLTRWQNTTSQNTNQSTRDMSIQNTFSNTGSNNLADRQTFSSTENGVKFIRPNSSLNTLPKRNLSDMINNELTMLNENAQSVRNMLSGVDFQTARYIDFEDYTKTLNMAADNINTFSETSLSQSGKEFSNAKRLAFASVKISNDALEQIRNKIDKNNNVYVSPIDTNNTTNTESRNVTNSQTSTENNTSANVTNNKNNSNNIVNTNVSTANNVSNNNTTNLK